jgi:hypothetical protein
MTTRPTTAAPILVVLAIMLLTLGAAYVGGYFWLGERFGVVEKSAIVGEPSSIVRVYPKWWLARAFAPAAKVETWLGNTRVAVESEDTERQALP